MKSEVSGWLIRVDRICQDRSQKVRQLKTEGKKIIGYLCCFAPLEIITAVDMVLLRIVGNVYINQKMG